MYCTKQDLIDRFGENELKRYAWDHAQDVADDDQIDRAITDASETINIYIGRITSLPLASTPAVITSLACDIARYRLQDDNPLDVVRERHEAAIRRLQDLAQGKASLQLPEDAGDSPGDVWTQRDETDRTFTHETLADY
jgi:phage gp36-like protein